MSKYSVTVTAFRPFEKNTLRGFVSVRINELRLNVHDLCLHEKNGRKWVALPSKPMLDKDRNPIQDDDGKPKFSPILQFDDRDTANAFSTQVIEAVDRHRKREGL